MMRGEQGSSNPRNAKHTLGDSVQVDGINGKCVFIRRARTPQTVKMSIVQLPSVKHDCVQTSRIRPLS